MTGPITGPDLAGAFDEHHPPDAALVGDCVHCGFCLPTCPTYVLWGEEMDSPRGRIHLMKQGLEGAPMTDSMVAHWDACLGCMACVSACPSGVQYDRLIEATRAQVERRHER
ncbi:MAG: 4Fe-4S dicluster domain-containing protein, partial [Nocardioidaceae bacterium]